MIRNENVKLSVPFESLVHCIEELSIREKYHLWLLLNNDLARTEEEVWDMDPVVRAEIQDARAAYESGDYVTIDEYMAQSGENS